MTMADAIDVARPKQRRDPHASRKRILEAASAAFARHGLGGARVDSIAASAGLNKQLVYYHFGSKEALYVAVLEALYKDIRSRERGLDLEHLPPAAALGRFVEFSFDYFLDNPHFVPLLNDENIHRAAHIKQSPEIPHIHSPLIDMLSRTIRRGEQLGVFRRGIDPVQLYISIAGLCYFYFSNIHTLSVIFDRDLTTTAERDQRRAHVLRLVRDAVLIHQSPENANAE